MITKKKTWVCVAANGQNIKTGNGHSWRCCFGRPGHSMSGEIQIADCVITGKAKGTENFLWRSNKNGGTNMDGVVGWIEFFGDVEIGNDNILRIILGNPDTSNSG